MDVDNSNHHANIESVVSQEQGAVLQNDRLRHLGLICKADRETNR